MNGQEAHLLLNHLPVIGALWTLLLLGAAFAWPSRPLGRAALAFTILTGLAGVPAFLSGEPAEEIIEDLPGLADAPIHAHEEMAERALIVGLVGMAVALASLGWARRRLDRRATVVPSLLSMILVAALMAWTAHLGGQIRRPELTSGGVAVPPGPPAGETHDD